MQPKSYFYFRMLWTLIFLGHFCADLLLTAYDGEVQLYLLSLSRWALVVQVADNMLQLYCTASGLDALPTNDPKEFEEVPDAVSSSVALFATSQPLSFLVVVWYWGFEHWGHQEMPSYLGFFLHFISWILQLISLMVCRIPLSCSHGGWLLAFVTSFIVWSYVHYALRIGMPGGCRSYTQPECPMYSALDWHKRPFIFFVYFVFSATSEIIPRIFPKLHYIMPCGKFQYQVNIAFLITSWRGIQFRG